MSYINKKHDIYNELNQNKILGFWIYLMSDCIIFAILFASYFVFYSQKQSFIKIPCDIIFVFVETILLLISSIIYGYSNYVIKNKKNLFFCMILTFLLGLIFVIMELVEFNHLLNIGFNPQYNSFISIFFTIIGIHCLHVIIGLLWIIVLIYKLLIDKKIEQHKTDILCLGMFWHFLDIIWIIVFSFIYLMSNIK